MGYRKTILCLVLAVVFTTSISAQAFSEPVLIKLTLEKQSDYENAISLGVVAYQRFDNFFLVEFERTKLEQLDKVGLKYQIIDETPWSEEYFLVLPIEGMAKINLESYGKVLLIEPEWTLIKTSKEKVFELMKIRYRVSYILHKPIPLKYKPLLKITRPVLKYSAGIDSLVNLVSEDSLRSWVQRLQDFKTRFTFSDSIPFARQWILDKFANFGISDVKIDTFSNYNYNHNPDTCGNIVAVVPGTSYPDRLIVVGGHYDSIRWHPDSTSKDYPNIFAPGADDNASGTSAVLELSRIISAHPLKCTVIFVAFDSEEPWPQSLAGSRHYANSIYYQGVELDLMLNFDMIGYTNDIDPDVTIYHGLTSPAFGQIMANAATTYASLRPVLKGTSGGSDSWPFYQKGYDVLYAEEGDFNSSAYHTPGDTIGIMDIPYMTKVVKMGLATLVLIGNSPSPVENLKAQNTIQGHTIYLSWSASPPEENVAYYKVYFGTKSGDYDSVHQVSATCDTLRNLEKNTTWFMAVTAVSSDGFESLANNEISLIPTALVAKPIAPFKVRLSWTPYQETPIDYYNVYRSEESGTGYQLLSGECRDTTFVDSTVQGNVEYYYYTITLVDTNGNESGMSGEAKSIVVTLDQGILLVDETIKFNAWDNLVNRDSTNAFYSRALQNYTYAYTDHNCPVHCTPSKQINLKELRRYRVIVIHSEDNDEYYSMATDGDSTYLVLKDYLSCGGKAIIEGRRNLYTWTSYQWGLKEFSPGDIPYDYFKVKSVYVPHWESFSPDYRNEEFIGAFSQISGYPDLQVDSLRVEQCNFGGFYDTLQLGGKVPGVGYIDSLIAGEVIYTFNSAYDTSSSEGKPVAFRYLGSDYKVIYFDFPLYFIQEPQAIELLHKALSDFDMFSGVEENGEAKIPTSFSLGQNYPNPFNSQTAIEYNLPKASQVRIDIYNILGQKIRTLANRTETAGYRRTIWDGKNNNGQTVSSGVYFYRIEAGNFVQTKKMLLLK